MFSNTGLIRGNGKRVSEWAGTGGKRVIAGREVRVRRLGSFSFVFSFSVLIFF